LCGGGCGKHEAFTGFGQVDGEDADEQRDRGDHLEVHQALPADAADFTEVTMAGDAGDQRAENQRSDDDFDQAEEDVAEYAQLNRKGRGVKAEFEAGEHGEEDPEGERALFEAC
jgi:hypothetical protein